MSAPASPSGRSLRTPPGVDLPIAWARRHDRAAVGFSHGGRSLGWHAYLVGDDGRVLLSFPWYDHVDVALGGVSRWSFAPWRVLFADRPPTEVGDEGWDDVEQGWWGFVIPDGGDFYVGETDFDAITELDPPLRITCAQPGNVLVDDVLVTWNCLARHAYATAWQEAVRSCRRGRPRPVGERRETGFEFRSRRA
jgi:hypothetical protein